MAKNLLELHTVITTELSTMKFENKVLMLGYGSVAKCTLPILMKHVRIPYQNMTIIDFEDKENALKKWTDKGIKFVQKKITQQRRGNYSVLIVFFIIIIGAIAGAYLIFSYIFRRTLWLTMRKSVMLGENLVIRDGVGCQ